MNTRLHRMLLSAILTTVGTMMWAVSTAQLVPVDDEISINWNPTTLTPNIAADDGSFISSPNNAQALGEVEMSNVIEPGLYTLFTVRILARKLPPGGPGGGQGAANRGLDVNVRINGELLGEEDVMDLTNDFAFYNFVFSGSFTHEDLQTMQVLFATNGRTNGANLRYVDIDYLEVVLPDPAPLPVKLKSFNAQRKQGRVELNWITSMEQNNSGFELQKNAGSGGWQSVEFIPSQASEGNSQSEISYYYSDANDARGVTQYRLKQIDIDNKFEYSMIRAVHGMSQSGRTLVFPNPGKGSLNVLFESAGQRDLLLTDMAGRIVKQWNNYADNSLQISNLHPGSYQLRIIDRETKTWSIEKIMVVNR